MEARTARAPLPGLRCASPHKSPLPGAARREVGAWAVGARTPRALPRRRCGAGRDAPLRRREAQRPWPRAQRASTSDLAHLSERSAQRVASYAPGQGREHRRVVGEAGRLSEASRPAPRRLRRHKQPERIAEREVALCAPSVHQPCVVGRESTPNPCATWLSCRAPHRRAARRHRPRPGRRTMGRLAARRAASAARPGPRTAARPARSWARRTRRVR